MSDIKIFVSHRIDLDSETIDNPLYIPVRCGAIFDKRENVTMLGDNTGDNISDKRMSFCELTVQYWAWKNVDADYYGLCHYRRYFSFSNNKLPEDIWGNVVYDFIDEKAIQKMNLYHEHMESFIKNYDFLVGTPYKMSMSVQEQFDSVPYLSGKDLEIAIKVLEDLYPEYTDAAHKYLRGKDLYTCNMFIMNKEFFFHYSDWLFNILNELELRLDTTNYGTESLRTIAHIGERMLGIYYTYCKDHTKGRWGELQQAFFCNTEKQTELLPAFKIKNIPLVFTSSDHFAPYTASTLQSIIKVSHSEQNYDIIILCASMTDYSKQLLNEIISDRDNFSLRYFNVSKHISKYKLKTANHLTIETFYRLYVPKLFCNYSKILYLDSDLIVQYDIAKLFHIDINDNFIAAVRDPDFISQYNGAIPKIKYYTNHVLKIKDPYGYFQAGVMIFNISEIRKHFADDEFLQLAQKRKYLYADQDVLNMKFQGRVFYLDMSWNVMSDCGGGRLTNIKNFAPLTIRNEYLDARKNPRIIHYAGYIKPWNIVTSDFSKEFWSVVRDTFLYDILWFRLVDSRYGGSIYDLQCRAGLFDTRTGIRKLADKMLPKGSHRRNFVKKLLPKGSRRWNFLKYIYCIFRPQYRPQIQEYDLK